MNARILLLLILLVGLAPVPAAASPVPVVGDFDGDGFPDMGTFESTTGEWIIALASSPRPLRIVWGAAGDVP